MNYGRYQHVWFSLIHSSLRLRRNFEEKSTTPSLILQTWNEEAASDLMNMYCLYVLGVCGIFEVEISTRVCMIM